MCTPFMCDIHVDVCVLASPFLTLLIFSEFLYFYLRIPTCNLLSASSSHYRPQYLPLFINLPSLPLLSPSSSHHSSSLPPSFVSLLDSSMKADLSRLNYWAKIRHSHRNKKNALDQYLRHKTELSLSVRTDQKTLKYVVSGFTTWSNATSTSLVSEFMILMCETVGGMCQGLGAPVLYKTQAPHPPLSSTSFIILISFMRSVLWCAVL